MNQDLVALIDDGTTYAYIDAETQKESAGLTSTVTVSAGVDQIQISAVTARLFDNAAYTGNLHDYVVAGDTFTIPESTTRFIVVNYNSGAPVMQSLTDSNDINESNIIPVVTCFNDNHEIHYRAFNNWADGALNKHNQRLVFTRHYLRQSGLSISEVAGGNRYLTVSEGIVWYGISKYVTEEVSSGASEFLYYYYHDGLGAWTSSKTTGAYDNTMYDHATSGSIEMTAGKYGVNWIYLMIADDENEIMYTQSRDQYDSLALAQAATIPAAPAVFTSHCIQVGRVIFLKGASTASLIESAYDMSFTGSQISDHNSLTGLDGGTAGEYYHMTHTQHDVLTDGAASDADTLHTHKVAGFTSGTIGGATIATSNITVGAGKTLNVSDGTLTLANDQISGDKVEGGTIAATTITALTLGSMAGNWTNAGRTVADGGSITTIDINGGTIDGMTIDTSDITVGSTKTLNVSGGTLELADNQISGDKVEGGTIAATTITTLTSTTANVTTLDTNVAAAGVTLAGTTLAADGTDGNIDITVTPKGTGSVVMSKVDINAGTIDAATIATSDITVGSGKTLDVSAGTLTLADNQISGDKVEGGTINATTVTTLTSTTGNITTTNSTTVNATTFDTNVAAAGVTLAGTTLSADGTDANIDVNITAKGTGAAVHVNCKSTGNIIRPFVTLTLASGVNSNIALPNGKNFYITGPTGSFSITGFTGGVDGREITIYNPINQNMTITNDATSTAANRILILTNNLVTANQGVVNFIYSGTASHWIHVGSVT